MKFFIFILITLLLLSLGVWLFIELRFLFEYNSTKNDDFLRAPFHSMISITISTIGILINVMIAVFIAYYLNQQRSDSRRAREHAEKIVCDLRTLIWELDKIAKDSITPSREQLLLNTRCETKIYSMEKLKKYVKNFNYDSIFIAWEELGAFLMWRGFTDELEKARQADILKSISDIDRICDNIITDLWVKRITH